MNVVENLYGVVLAGGRSSRMGRDKATLVYRGQLQVDRAALILKMRCEKTFVSLREQQENPSTGSAAQPLEDRFGSIGPLGGILSAFFYHRDKDFLVMSCSLPFVNLRLVDHLISSRNRTAVATVYRNRQGYIQPYFGIYENRFKDVILRAAKSGERDMQKLLQEHGAFLVDAPSPDMLDEVNDSKEYLLAQKRMIGV